jgi:hypothetical protein
VRREGIGFACSRLVPEGKGACLRRTPYSGVDFTGWIVNVPVLEAAKKMTASLHGRRKRLCLEMNTCRMFASIVSPSFVLHACANSRSSMARHRIL